MRVTVVSVDQAIDGRAHHREQPRRRRRPVELSDEPRRREVERRAGRLGRQVDKVVVRLERRRLARPHLLLVVRASARAVVHALFLARPVVLGPKLVESVRRVGRIGAWRGTRRGGERRLRSSSATCFPRASGGASSSFHWPQHASPAAVERVRVRRGEDGSEVLEPPASLRAAARRERASAGSRRDARREPGLPRRGAAPSKSAGSHLRASVERGLRRTWWMRPPGIRATTGAAPQSAAQNMAEQPKQQRRWMGARSSLSRFGAA